MLNKPNIIKALIGLVILGAVVGSLFIIRPTSIFGTRYIPQGGKDVAKVLTPVVQRGERLEVEIMASKLSTYPDVIQIVNEQGESLTLTQSKFLQNAGADMEQLNKGSGPERIQYAEKISGELATGKGFLAIDEFDQWKTFVEKTKAGETPFIIEILGCPLTQQGDRSKASDIELPLEKYSYVVLPGTPVGEYTIKLTKNTGCFGLSFTKNLTFEVQ